MLSLNAITQLIIAGIAFISFATASWLALRFWSQHKSAKTSLRAAALLLMTIWSGLLAAAALWPSLQIFSHVSAAIAAILFTSSYLIHSPFSDDTEKSNVDKVDEIMKSGSNVQPASSTAFAPATTSAPGDATSHTSEEKPEKRTAINQSEILPPLARPKSSGWKWITATLALFVIAGGAGAVFFSDTIKTTVGLGNEETLPDLPMVEETTLAPEITITSELTSEPEENAEAEEAESIRVATVDNEFGFANCREETKASATLVQRLEEDGTKYEVTEEVTNEAKESWVTIKIDEETSCNVLTELVTINNQEDQAEAEEETEAEAEEAPAVEEVLE